MLFDQIRREPVVAGGNGGMGRKYGIQGYASLGTMKGNPVVFHDSADLFEDGKCTVSLVQMQHAGRDIQRLQDARSADPQQQLLSDAQSVVAAVQPGGQFPIFG